MNTRLGVVTAAVVASIFTVILMLPFNARSVQNTLGLPTTGVFSGLAEQNAINAALDALLTCNSGSAAPTNALGGAPKEGQCWLDTTSSTLKIKKRYSGSGWVIEGVIDVTNGLYAPPIGGGTGSVASAGTTDPCAAPQAVQTVTGTTTITSLGSSCVVGVRKTLIFAGAVLLTYNVTSLILPGQVNYTTAAGDVVEAIYLGSGNWRVIDIDRINGSAVINPAVEVGTMHYYIGGTAPTKYVFGFGQSITRTSFPDYVTATTRVQTATATSGNNTLTSVADTSSMGAGMPVEGSCIPANTTIASVTGATIVMSANATTNGACSVTAFFTGYGAGGSSATIGVPDCRGRALAGRDDMGGTAASRLTTAGFGTGATALNASGSSAETETLSLAQLPTGIASNNPSNAILVYANGNSSLVTPADATTGWGLQPTPATGGNQVPFTVSGAGVVQVTSYSANNSINVTSNNTSGGAHRTVMPTLIAQCIVRVLTLNLPANDNRPAAAGGRAPVAIARRFA